MGKRRETKNGEMVMFSGLVICPDCGRKHYLHKGGKENRYDWLYNCGSYRRKGRDCTSHSIRLGVLEAIVTAHLRMITNLVAVDEKAFAERLMEKGSKSQKSDMAKKKQEFEKAKRRVAELDILFNKIYEDRTLGSLSEERYQKMAVAYEQEHQTLSASLTVLERELQDNADTISGVDKFIRIVKKHGEFSPLLPYHLRATQKEGRNICHPTGKSFSLLCYR